MVARRLFQMRVDRRDHAENGDRHERQQHLDHGQHDARLGIGAGRIRGRQGRARSGDRSPGRRGTGSTIQPKVRITTLVISGSTVRIRSARRSSGADPGHDIGERKSQHDRRDRDDHRQAQRALGDPQVVGILEEPGEIRPERQPGLRRHHRQDQDLPDRKQEPADQEREARADKDPGLPFAVQSGRRRSSRRACRQDRLKSEMLTGQSSGSTCRSIPAACR